jgi:trigger factor
METEVLTKEDSGFTIIKVTIPAAEVNTEINTVTAMIANEVEVPGFRKGKVPTHMIQNKFKEYIREGVAEELIKKTYPDASKTVDIPIADIRVNTPNTVKSNSDYTYEITLIPRPSLKLGDYQDIEIVKTEYTYSDDDINKYLEQQQRDSAVLVEKESDIIEPDDVVSIEYGYYLFQLDESTVKTSRFNFPKKEDQSEQQEWAILYPHLEGMETNEEKHIDLTIPADFENENLAGKNGKLYFRILKIETYELPELDDEFAKDLGYESLEVFRDSIERIIKQMCINRTENETLEAIKKKIVENSILDIAPGLLMLQAGERLEEVYKGISEGNVDQDFIRRYGHLMSQKPNEVYDALKQDIQDEYTDLLLAEELAKVENLVPESDDEILQSVKNLIEQAEAKHAEDKKNYGEVDDEDDSEDISKVSIEKKMEALKADIKKPEQKEHYKYIVMQNRVDEFLRANHKVSETITQRLLPEMEDSK